MLASSLPVASFRISILPHFQRERRSTKNPRLGTPASRSGFGRVWKEQETLLGQETDDGLSTRGFFQIVPSRPPCLVAVAFTSARTSTSYISLPLHRLLHKRKKLTMTSSSRWSALGRQKTASEDPQARGPRRLNPPLREMTCAAGRRRPRSGLSPSCWTALWWSSLSASCSDEGARG